MQLRVPYTMAAAEARGGATEPRAHRRQLSLPKIVYFNFFSEVGARTMGRTGDVFYVGLR